MIDDLQLRGEIVIDLKARLCYSKFKTCEREITILEDFRLPKLLCNFTDGSFAIKGNKYFLDDNYSFICIYEPVVFFKLNFLVYSMLDIC